MYATLNVNRAFGQLNSASPLQRVTTTAHAPTPIITAYDPCGTLSVAAADGSPGGTNGSTGGTTGGSDEGTTGGADGSTGGTGGSTGTDADSGGSTGFSSLTENPLVLGGVGLAFLALVVR